MTDTHISKTLAAQVVYIGEHAVRAPGLRSTLAISCWSGLLAGYAELASFQVRVQWAQGGLLRRSPHVYWMMPLSNMILFALIGVCIEVLVWWIPRWTATILAVSLSSLGFLAVLLTLPGLKAVASLMLAIGLGSWIGPALVARSARFAQVVKWTLPAMIVVMLLMACLIVSVRTAQRSQWDYGWVSPVSGSPNVLLIVLDTVRHDATSLDGEGRDTTPFLRSLASRGASFSQAIAPTSWTLTSHASMFTARWPWELGTGPDRPLDARYPTLAEWMSSRGYRTAGIVANTVFCSEEYGLSRGFQHYEDYIITPVEVVRASSIGWLFTSRLWKLQAWLGSGMGFQTRAPQTEETHRKTAGEINEAALNWIGQSRDRPFFLYLNYLDAHDPYILPAGAPWSFGPPPASLSQWNTLADWDSQITQARNRDDVRLARDAYDNCLAYLDRQLANLFGALERTGSLANTIVVVTADHGEEFGENFHNGRPLYGHGEWVYQPAVHVPLLVIAPGQIRPQTKVDTPVSLRDLPATIVDLANQGPTSPFLGGSLVPLAGGISRVEEYPPSIAFSEFDPYRDLSHERQVMDPSARVGMQAVIAEGHAYLQTSNGLDRLYNLATDPWEQGQGTVEKSKRELLGRMQKRLRESAPTLPRSRRLEYGLEARESGPISDLELDPEVRGEAPAASRSASRVD